MASKRNGTLTTSKMAISAAAARTVLPSKLISSSLSQSSQPVTFKDLQDLKDTFTIMIKNLKDSFQDSLGNIVKQLDQKYNDLREDIWCAFERLVPHIERIEERVNEVAEHVERLEERMGKMEDINDLNQNEITKLHYKEMEFALRVRGLKEDVKNNLREVIAADLAVVLECGPDEILKDIEIFFRVNSWVARQRNLPRDVVIYFSTRKRRNQIIQAFYRQRFQIAAQDVIILKEIPPKILKGRKDYVFLSDELKKRQISFRWDIPVGIVVTFGGTRYRLNSVLKAKDFYVSILKWDFPSSPRVKRVEERLEVSVGEMPSIQVKDASVSKCDYLSSPRVKRVEEMSEVSVGETLPTKITSQLGFKVKEDLKGQMMTCVAYKRKEKEQQKLGTAFTYPIPPEPVGRTRMK